MKDLPTMFSFDTEEHIRNKLTLTKSGTRLKLNSIYDKRLISFAVKIDLYLRDRHLINSTLRGEFIFIPTDTFEIKLSSNNKKVIFVFTEGKEEPTLTDDAEQYLLKNTMNI